MQQVFLSRRNLLSLLSKLDRRAEGDESACTIIKRDDVHPKFPQTMKEIWVTAVEDEDYYADRAPGPVHPADEPKAQSQTNAVYCIEWDEYESGWGQRPDGTSYHVSLEEALRYKEKTESIGSYQLFWRGTNPKLVHVDQTIYNKVLEEGTWVI